MQERTKTSVNVLTIRKPFESHPIPFEFEGVIEVWGDLILSEDLEVKCQEIHIHGRVDMNDVKIIGDAVIDGELNVYNISVTGNLMCKDSAFVLENCGVTGDLTCIKDIYPMHELHVGGNLYCAGDVDGEIEETAIICNKEFICKRDVRAKSIYAAKGLSVDGDVDLSGNLTTFIYGLVNRNLNCEQLCVICDLKVTGWISATNINVQGNLTCTGSINSNAFEVGENVFINSYICVNRIRVDGNFTCQSSVSSRRGGIVVKGDFKCCGDLREYCELKAGGDVICEGIVNSGTITARSFHCYGENNPNVIVKTTS